MNKRQYQLKTIQMDQWAEFNPFGQLKTAKTVSQSLQNSQRLKQSLKQKVELHRHSQILKPSTKRIPQAKLETFEINRQTFTNFCSKKKMAKHTTSSNYKNFPTRQPQVRNSNPFRFFLNSAINKNIVTQNSQQVTFHYKLSKIMSELPAKRVLLTSQNSRQLADFMKNNQRRDVYLNKKRPNSVSQANYHGKFKKDEEPSPWQQQNNEEQPYYYTEF